MKRTLAFFLASFLVVSSSQAQSWELFQGDTVHYLKHRKHNFMSSQNSNIIGLTVLIDTSYQRNSEAITLLKKDFSHINNLNQGFGTCVPSSPSVFGDSIVKLMDTSYFFINSLNPIRWEKNAGSWLFYSDVANNQLLIHLDSAVLKGTDSLRYYSFNSVVSGTHPLQQFDTAKFILSKQKGLIKGFDFSVFPDTLEAMEFFKLNPITNRDIYNYEIGDEYHYTHHSHASQGMTLEDKFIMKLINKTFQNSDSVDYDFERTVYDEYASNFQGHPVRKSQTYKDTVSFSYNLNKRIGSGSFIDTVDLHENFEIGFFSDFYSLPSYWKMSGVMFDVDSGKLCNYTFEQSKRVDYVFGIGHFTYMVDYSGGSMSDVIESLVYYKKGNITWGTPLQITVGMKEPEADEIKLYPNPVEDYLIAEGFKSTWSYELIDISGQLLKKGELEEHEDRILIGQFKPGIYFIKIRSAADVHIHKIVVK